MSHTPSTVMRIVDVNCKRLRQLVTDPLQWSASEILFVIDRLQAQVREEVQWQTENLRFPTN